MPRCRQTTSSMRIKLLEAQLKTLPARKSSHPFMVFQMLI